MNVSLDNYSKATPAGWKLVGDVFLYSIPIVNGAVMAMPGGIDPVVREWIIWGWSLLSSLIKIFTKYISE